MLNNRYIYVFGGFKTTHFSKSNLSRVNKKFEITDNVTLNYIEKYDTLVDVQDENDAKLTRIQHQRYKVIGLHFPDPYDSSPYDSSSSDFESINPNKNRKLFERIYVKRDNVNNVGNLICFPIVSKMKEAEN